MLWSKVARFNLKKRCNLMPKRNSDKIMLIANLNKFN